MVSQCADVTFTGGGVGVRVGVGVGVEEDARLGVQRFARGQAGVELDCVPWPLRGTARGKTVRQQRVLTGSGEFRMR